MIQTKISLKKVTGGLSILTLLVLLGLIYWKIEVKYWLPTPMPANYKVVSVGSKITHRKIAHYGANKNKFLHFYSPVCPCTKFNEDHYIKLVKQYSPAMEIIMVVSPEHLKEDFSKWTALGIDVLKDTDGSLAKMCGIYSTPQGVLLDKSNSLFFKGNYNKSRYCISPGSNYVSIALDSLKNENPAPIFNSNATIAYGCSYEKENNSTFAEIRSILNYGN